MTKALVFGTGAVGCVYGYILHKAGVRVVTACRSNYEAVKEAGITIRSALYGNVHYQPIAVRSLADANSHGPFDYILVCSKAFPGGSNQIETAVSPETSIVVAQNGIGIEEEYLERYPNNTIISGVVWVPTAQVAPGVVVMGPNERLDLGTYPADAPTSAKAKVDILSKLWVAGGGNAPVYDDIQARRWLKLSVNFAFNPISALTRCDGSNFLLSSEVADDLIVKVMRQVGQIAAAEGYTDITEESIQERMKYHRARTQTGGKDPSMLMDVKAGRPIEVDAILGNTLRIARKHGIDVPLVEMLYGLARALNFSIVKDERWVPLLLA